jgi:hypothetical protein
VHTRVEIITSKNVGEKDGKVTYRYTERKSSMLMKKKKNS